MAFPVKWFSSDFRGAPVLSGTAGAFVAMLDACLIDGFGAITPTKIEVAGNIATVTVNAGDTFTAYAVISVSGATPAQLNGEARVLTSGSTSFTFPTDAADGLATGTISIRYAPVGGWEKTYSGTNKAVYRSTDPLASGFYLRVDDTGTTSARVVGYESMTDVDTGTNPFPADAQIIGGGYVGKSTSANSVAVRYDVVADSRLVLHAIAIATASNYTTSPARGFGDLIPLAPGADGYAVALSCGNSASIGSGAFDQGRSGAASIYLARALSGAGGSMSVECSAFVGNQTSYSGADGTLGAFPSVVDGEMKCCARFVRNGTTTSDPPRAIIPGVLHIPQSGVTALVSSRDTLNGAGALAGRKLRALTTQNSAGGPPVGVYLVDIYGPWR